MNSALKGLPLAMIAALTLAGCAKDGHYHDRNEDYAGARQAAPLTLPGSRDQSRYRDIMPVVPVIDAGLTPLLQWIIVPTLAYWAATRVPLRKLFRGERGSW